MVAERVFWRSRRVLDPPSHHPIARSQDIQLACRKSDLEVHQTAASRSVPVTPCPPSKQRPEFHYLLATCRSLEYASGRTGTAEIAADGVSVDSNAPRQRLLLERASVVLRALHASSYTNIFGH